MKSLLRKGIEILRSEGPTAFLLRGIDYFYRRTVAPLLPRRTVQYNEVDVPAARLFDGVLPWRSTKDRPNYESGLIEGLEQYVQPGADVIIVGGGWGVTTVKAAENAGEEGHVTVYEGSKKEAEMVRRTVEINGHSDTVTVNHTIVGTALNLRSDEGDAEIIESGDLPDCDILELDCEGTEVEILRDMTIHPDIILVESHGLYDAPTDKLKEILRNKSYSIESIAIADKDQREKCEIDDVHALTASKIISMSP